MNIDTFVFIMELIGTIAFASAGAMVAVEKEMDVLGVCVLGMTTAVGGGMIRDLILGVNPPMMFRNPVYALVAIAFSLLVFVVAYYNHKLQESRLYIAYDRLMMICDSLGLAIFTVVGVNAAWNMEYETTTFLQIFVGVLTGVGGGVLRDVMAGNRPYIFVKHVYASASIIGAVVTIVLMKFFGDLVGMVAGAVIVFVIRILAAYFKWNLPRIRKD